MMSETIELLVIDTLQNQPKTGDAPNLTAYVSIDDGPLAPLTNPAAFEIDAVKGKGLYRFSLSNAERTGSKFLFTGSSTTAGVAVVPRTFSLELQESLTQLRGLIQSSAGASILTTVRPGGKLVLKAGDDYVASELYTIDIPIDDASEAAYALLTRSQTSIIKFGASKAHATQTDQIAGTASKAAVYKNAGKTYVPVEVLGSQLTNLIVGDNFRYDVQITSNAGKKRTVCTGVLAIEKDNAA